MSTHVRRQIREAAKVALLGLASTADRVFTGDPYGKDPDELGGAFLIVAAPEEAPNPDYDDMGSKRGRRLTLLVVGYASAIEIEDVLDAIGMEVEQALEGNLFGGLAKDTMFARASKVMDDQGRKRSGEIRLEFAVDYRMARGQPAAAVG